MTRRCRMCNRSLRISLWEWLTCPISFCAADDVSGCIATYKSMTEEPPVEEPPFPDPQVESPPDDLWTCPSCVGSGVVFVRRDWETGSYEFDDCVPCGGVGDLKAVLL